MTDSRKIKAKKNIVTSLFSQIVMLACGIIIPRMMIGAFGSESYGLTTSITQFLAYITLLEGGIGGVVRAALYKPLSQNDISKVSSIMLETKRFFRVIAWIFAAYVLVLALSFQTISHIVCMEWISTFILVIVISISTFGQYFIGISYSILLQADQRTYITNIISVCATVLNTVCTIFLIYLDFDLISVKLVSSCIFFMRPVVLWLYVKKRYTFDDKYASNTKTKYLSEKWNGLSQHIAYFLHSNTDIAVLTILSDLRSVAVYSIYNMITSHIQTLAISFSSGMEAMFGDMIARDEKNNLKNTFQTYETMLSVVSVILFSVTSILIIPFIELYASGITDANYIQPLFALFMIVSSLSYCLRLPYHSAVIAAGHFKQTKIAAYGEAVVNILLSIILVIKYDLIGVAIATLIATWFRFIYYVFYLSKHILFREIKLFIKRFIINIGIFTCNCVIGYRAIMHFRIDNYFVWALCGIGLTLGVCLFTIAINMIFFGKDFKTIIKKRLGDN